MKRAIFFVLPLGFAAACSAGGGGDKQGPGGAGSAGSATNGAGGILAGSTGSGTSSGSGSWVPAPPCNGVCADFPMDPVVDTSQPPVPPDPGGLFGPPDNFVPSGGPCLVEPPIGALFPQNWLRPRFRWIPPPGHDLFEIRLHAGNQQNDLVVYTTSTQWIMPKDMWHQLASHTVIDPITVTLRSVSTASPGTPNLGAQGPITVAPVTAEGKMVYWATIGESPPDAWLAGFGVGEEGVLTALKVDQVVQAGRKDQGGNPRGDGSVTCIGCHTATPDGDSVAFTDHWPWGIAMASVEELTVGQMPTYMTPGAAETMNQPWLGAPSFSRAHFTAGDRLFITSYGRSGGQIWDGSTWTDQPNAKLAWFNLETTNPAGPTSGSMLAGAEGTAFGFITRTGDPRGAMMPHFSHDGNSIVYVSTNAGKDGRLGLGTGDLYTVPYNNKAGGTATPVPGASDSAYNEFYPQYSPDDRFIAFNRTASNVDMYYNPTSEVYVIPTAGGTPTRLAANDPVACTGLTSPGITNSWPRWSPDAPTHQGKTYYWMIFSSTRDGYAIQKLPQKKASQLYMTSMVVENGQITTYPGVYIWNQPIDTSNHTPAWDVFKIPPAPVPR